MKNIILCFSAALIWTLTLSSCASSTEGGEVGAKRRQLFLVSSEQIQAMSADAYEKTKADAASKSALDKDAMQVKRVQSALQRLAPTTSVFRAEAPKWAWEAHVIKSDEVNAYCMPGGKIMFYSGIIEKLKLTDGEIAAIMGHEIAHALREHGRERMSEEVVRQYGVQIVLATGKVPAQYGQALDMLTNLAVSLPHGRGQETEADEIGVELMARAGYDPREAVTLWKKMHDAGGSKPPEILSSHPSDDKRMQRIQSLLPKVMPLYEAARKATVSAR